MSTIEEIKQRIAVANGKSQQLNAMRQQNIGRKQTLEKQIKENLEAYAQKYGRQVTVETLQDEITVVTKEIEAKVFHIEGVLKAIESGDYATAQRLADGEKSIESTTTPKPVEVIAPHPSEQVPVGVQGVTTQPIGVAQPIAQPVGVSQPIGVQPTATKPTAAQPIGVQPSAAQPIGVQPTATQTQAPVFQTGNAQLDKALAGFTPAGVAQSPVEPPKPTGSFAQSLNVNMFEDL